jgi:anthranilate/para-aminobenzoate synthase component I
MIAFQNHQALIGSSPETMVRLKSGIATLRPIAGTLNNSAALSGSLETMLQLWKSLHPGARQAL